jgi:hypothetical protein
MAFKTDSQKTTDDFIIEKWIDKKIDLMFSEIKGSLNVRQHKGFKI